MQRAGHADLRERSRIFSALLKSRALVINQPVRAALVKGLTHIGDRKSPESEVLGRKPCCCQTSRQPAEEEAVQAPAKCGISARERTRMQFAPVAAQ